MNDTTPANGNVIIDGTESICSCCGKQLSTRDVQVMIVRDAYEKNITPPDEHTKQCYQLIAKALDDRPIVSWSPIVYFCKTCIPTLPGGTDASAPKS